MLLLTDRGLPVDAIVRKNYRAAEIFKKYGISYCCTGRMTLENACARKGLDYNAVAEELEAAAANPFFPGLKVQGWKTDFLVDYLINVHHAYLHVELPVLDTNLTSFAHGHRKNYPELAALQELFPETVALLLDHIRDTESILFPYIRQVDAVFRDKAAYGNLFVKTLRKPLDKALARHKRMHEHMMELRAVTNGYTFPETVCVNYQVIYRRLLELDQRFVQYRYLEHDILFSKVMAIEQELLLA